MRIIITLLLISLLGLLAFGQHSRVSWFDDFIGVKISQAYNFSLSDTAAIQIASDPHGSGGMAMLSVVGYASGVARMRLGEDPVTGGINALNFSARKNLVYETRVFLNRNNHIAATIGFVGFSDPENALALVLDINGAEWGFQAANDGHGLTVGTGFMHEPGKWFTVRIEAEWGETPRARVYFNGETEPRAELCGDYIPRGGLCPEFQLWNRPLDGAYSQPTMWIDYLSVEQDR